LRAKEKSAKLRLGFKASNALRVPVALDFSTFRFRHQTECECNARKDCGAYTGGGFHAPPLNGQGSNWRADKNKKPTDDGGDDSVWGTTGQDLYSARNPSKLARQGWMNGTSTVGINVKVRDLFGGLFFVNRNPGYTGSMQPSVCTAKETFIRHYHCGRGCHYTGLEYNKPGLCTSYGVKKGMEGQYHTCKQMINNPHVTDDKRTGCIQHLKNCGAYASVSASRTFAAKETRFEISGDVCDSSKGQLQVSLWYNQDGKKQTQFPRGDSKKCDPYYDDIEAGITSLKIPSTKFRPRSSWLNCGMSPKGDRECLSGGDLFSGEDASLSDSSRRRVKSQLGTDATRKGWKRCDDAVKNDYVWTKYENKASVSNFLCQAKNGMHQCVLKLDPVLKAKHVRMEMKCVRKTCSADDAASDKCCNGVVCVPRAIKKEKVATKVVAIPDSCYLEYCNQFSLPRLCGKHVRTTPILKHDFCAKKKCTTHAQAEQCKEHYFKKGRLLNGTKELASCKLSMPPSMQYSPITCGLKTGKETVKEKEVYDIKEEDAPTIMRKAIKERRKKLFYSGFSVESPPIYYNIGTRKSRERPLMVSEPFSDVRGHEIRCPYLNPIKHPAVGTEFNTGIPDCAPGLFEHTRLPQSKIKCGSGLDYMFNAQPTCKTSTGPTGGSDAGGCVGFNPQAKKVVIKWQVVNNHKNIILSKAERAEIQGHLKRKRKQLKLAGTKRDLQKAVSLAKRRVKIWLSSLRQGGTAAGTLQRQICDIISPLWTQKEEAIKKKIEELKKNMKTMSNKMKIASAAAQLDVAQRMMTLTRRSKKQSVNLLSDSVVTAAFRQWQVDETAGAPYSDPVTGSRPITLSVFGMAWNVTAMKRVKTTTGESRVIKNMLCVITGEAPEFCCVSKGLEYSPGADHTTKQKADFRLKMF